MKTKLHKKIVSGLLTLITVITTFIGSGFAVFASELVLNEQAGYSYTGVSPHLGYAITHDNIYVMKVDGKKVFCVESGIFTTSGAGYIPETYVDDRKDKLSKIAYYGYTNTSKSYLSY